MKFLKLKIIEYILCAIITFVISFFVFVLLFNAPIFISIKVLMYRGLIFILLVAIFNLALGNVLKKLFFKNLNSFDLFSITVMFVSITLTFFILVPVTVERSISVFMLSEMEEGGASFTKEDIEDRFINTYVKEFGAFDKRFEEQVVTGTIDKIDNYKYIINEKGRFIVNLFRLIAKIFNTDERLVYPNKFK